MVACETFYSKVSLIDSNQNQVHIASYFSEIDNVENLKPQREEDAPKKVKKKSGNAKSQRLQQKSTSKMPNEKSQLLASTRETTAKSLKPKSIKLPKHDRMQKSESKIQG